MKKKVLFLASIAILAFTISCQKCATCTFNDPEKGTLTTEVCSSGHSYDSAIKVYEDNEWSCVAN